MQFPTFATVDDFVAWESRQPEKYEFSDGAVSLFPGGTLRHEIIIPNVIAALHRSLGAGRVRSSGVKQLTQTSSRYPDVSVSFDPRDTLDQTYARFPTLLIEVLSPSTHATDRGPKFDEYRTIETLREYVLIDSRKRWAQTIRRANAEWIISLPIISGSLLFESVAVTIPFDNLYAGTEL